ncbi:MAG TPA: thiamine phosphate synthase, partial [Candidatus Polarisedimenticolia bacterium]
MSPPARDRAPGVICVTDRRAAGGRPIADLVRAAVAAGADMVQIREKDLGGGPLLLLVKEAVAIAREAGARCRIIVNDR